MRPPIRGLTPLLVVSDLERSIDFYCRCLGFVEPRVHGDPPCFGMMNRDGFDLMLSVAEEPGGVRPNGGDGTWDVHVRVSDLEAEIEALRAAGVRIDKGPTDTFYAMREIEVLDPDGHRICLGVDVSPELETWEGTLDTGTARLRLLIEIAPSDTGLAGRIDSPDQGVANIPIESVVRSNGSLRLESKSIGAAFEGVERAGGAEIVGRWSQRGRDWPLVLRRRAP